MTNDELQEAFVIYARLCDKFERGVPMSREEKHTFDRVTELLVADLKRRRTAKIH